MANATHLLTNTSATEEHFDEDPGLKHAFWLMRLVLHVRASRMAQWHGVAGKFFAVKIQHWNDWKVVYLVHVVVEGEPHPGLQYTSRAASIEHEVPELKPLGWEGMHLKLCTFNIVFNHAHALIAHVTTHHGCVSLIIAGRKRKAMHVVDGPQRGFETSVQTTVRASSQNVAESRVCGAQTHGPWKMRMAVLYHLDAFIDKVVLIGDDGDQPTDVDKANTPIFQNHVLSSDDALSVSDAMIVKFQT